MEEYTDAQKAYYEKFLNPKWQKKKAEIQVRDKFTCQKCGSKDKTLHVHHRYYIYKRDPWEYSDDLLVLLCKDCHLEEENARDILQDMSKVLAYYGYFNTELREIVMGLIEAKNISNG